jgi:hypothetical protein
MPSSSSAFPFAISVFLIAAVSIRSADLRISSRARMASCRSDWICSRRAI